MGQLIQSRFTVLDSAQLGAWARARVSEQIEERRKAQAFSQALTEQGLVPVVMRHHLEELLGTESTSAAGAAVSLLNSLPLVATFRPADGMPGLGTVLDVLTAELIEAVKNSQADALSNASAIRESCFAPMSGEELMVPYISIWRELQPYSWAQAEHRRAAHAVSASQLFSLKKMKLKTLLAGRVRQGNDLVKQLAAMQLAMQRDVAAYGDKRISDPASVSQWFFQLVRNKGYSLPTTIEAFVRQALEMQHLSLEELNPEDTIADILSMGMFRSRIKLAAENAHLPIASAYRVDMEMIPSWLIESALSRHRQRKDERRGSEPVDAHLATLAPYAAFTFVDRRTAEAFRQALVKQSIPIGLIRNVLKSGPYTDAVRRIVELKCSSS